MFIPQPPPSHFPQFYVKCGGGQCLYTYTDILENGDVFFRYRKSFSPVHTKMLKQWKYDSIPYRACAAWCMTVVFKNLLFHPFSFWRPFPWTYLCYWYPKHRLRVNGRLKRGEGVNLRFQKYHSLTFCLLVVCLLVFSQKNTVMVVGCIVLQDSANSAQLSPF